MHTKLGFAAAAVGAFCLSATVASAAMPVAAPHQQAQQNARDAIQVRWVCNPWGRCWWRPNYYGAYGYYPGPRFYGPRPYRWGWHRPWHRRWHHW